MNHFRWCMPLAVVLFFAAIAITLFWQFFGKGKNNGRYTLCVTLAVLVSFLFARLPIRLGWNEPFPLGFLHSILDAVMSFSMSESLENVIVEGAKLINTFETPPGPGEIESFLHMTDWARLYTWFVIVQYIVGMGLCAFSFLITLTNWVKQKVFAVCAFAHTFVFTRPTKESIMLAQNIQRAAQEQKKRTVFCFASADRQTMNALEPELQSAGLKNVVLHPGMLTWSKLPRWTFSLSCILCSDEENANIELLHTLLEAQNAAQQKERVKQQQKTEQKSILKAKQNNTPEKYAPRGKNNRFGLQSRGQYTIKFYVVSESRNTERTVDALTTEYICNQKCRGIVTLINPAINLTMQVLNRIPLHVYAAACPQQKGRRKLNVLVAGSTAFARQFVCNAYACGQMANTAFSLTWAATDMECVRADLYAAAPALRHEEQDAVKACGALRFHELETDAAVADRSLVKDVQYVLLAYENDEENIQAARRIRRMIEQEKMADPSRREEKTAIVYAVGNPALARITESNDAMPNRLGYCACSMKPVGSREEQYSVESFFYNEMLSKGYFMDYAYSTHNETAMTIRNDVKKLKKEFKDFLCGMRDEEHCNNADKRSSVATALALEYRQSVIEAYRRGDLKTVYTSEQQMWEALAEAEHRRWVAYTHMLGFVAPTPEQLDVYFCKDGNTHKNMSLQLHPCLVTATAGSSGRLWTVGTEKAEPEKLDPLDRLSYDLHIRALDRLGTAYKHCLPPPLDLDQPVSITQANAEASLEAAKKLPVTEETKEMIALLKCLFKDFKAIDIRMVGQTEKVQAMAKDPHIAKTLSLLWLDM